jgi:hypothetical protein
MSTLCYVENLSGDRCRSRIAAPNLKRAKVRNRTGILLGIVCENHHKVLIRGNAVTMKDGAYDGRQVQVDPESEWPEVLSEDGKFPPTKNCNKCDMEMSRTEPQPCALCRPPNDPREREA